VVESFLPTVEEIAGRFTLAARGASMDALARDGLSFLRRELP
jgi:D-psicose/D-tagatose/L-ribulose 3-epimerase